VTALENKVRGIMNKITRDNFERLKEKLLSLNVASEGMLAALIDVVFNKALEDVFFQNMYADLFRALGVKAAVWSEAYLRVSQLADGAAPAGPGWYFDVSGSGAVGSSSASGAPAAIPWKGPFRSQSEAATEGLRHTSFKRLLLNRCQIEFQRDEGGDLYSTLDAEEAADTARRAAAGARGGVPLTPEEERGLRERAAVRDDKRGAIKRRTLSNISFIGHLYLIEGMLTTGIMHACLAKLTRTVDTARPDEEQAEALIKLLGVIGKKLDAEEQALPAAARQMPGYAKMLARLMEHAAVPHRTQFLCQNLLETRNAWLTELGLPTVPIVRKHRPIASLTPSYAPVDGGTTVKSRPPLAGPTPPRQGGGTAAAAPAAGTPPASDGAPGAAAAAPPAASPAPVVRGPMTFGPKSSLYKRPGQSPATPTGTASPSAGAASPAQ
jgi:translation initiation factor 4G